MKVFTKPRKAAAALCAALLCLLLTACGGTQNSVPEVSSASSIADASSAPDISSVSSAPAENSGEVEIALSDAAVTVDGVEASTDAGSAVYLSHDVIYYEDRDAYESGNPYGEGTDEERHSTEEAEGHTVVNITQPGSYRLSGSLSHGQIFVDLGEDAETDPQAAVTLILDNVDVACTVAPAVFFYRVYECDQSWVADDGQGKYAASAEQDTSQAGANVVIADGSVNNITGSHVARIYKDDEEQKKLHKYDGAFYSRMSMNIDGGEADTGVLNITADNEGLDSELHLTVNGGKINIQAQNDGINTNEDGVSVTTVNGGSLHIVAGLGSEGDGIDSNGYLVINGGCVVATGSTMDWAESDSEQVTMNLQFASLQGAEEAIVVTDTEGKVVFAYDPDKDETTGASSRGYQGAVISCPQFQVGETYQVYIGGDVEGTDTDGLYDISTTTGFSGGVMQQYTGTDVGMGFGRPGGGPQELPEGVVPPGDEGVAPGGDRELPEGGQPPEGAPIPPDGEQPFDGQQPPDGENFRPDREAPPEGFPSGQEEGEPSTQFTMADKVNAFSGVSDAG